MDLPQRIRAYRKALGLTQAQLAERLGMRSATVSDWERGKNAPSPGTLALLADLALDREGALRMLRSADSNTEFRSGVRQGGLPTIPGPNTENAPLRERWDRWHRFLVELVEVSARGEKVPITWVVQVMATLLAGWERHLDDLDRAAKEDTPTHLK